MQELKSGFCVIYMNENEMVGATITNNKENKTLKRLKMEESRTDDVGRECNFVFAFNNVNFSDRILNLEVVPDPCPQSHSLSPNPKRRRHSLSKGDEVSHDSGDSSLGISCSNVLRIRTVHISSSILAAKSPFFYKLFSNVTRESKQQNVTLQIHDSEEGAVMDLLNFMYGNTLSRTTSAAVLDVLVAADKFEHSDGKCYSTTDRDSKVVSCHTLRDITKFADEVLNLPLVGIEAVLSSDDLLIPSENCVYTFVLKWARRHYPKIEDRQQVLGSRLGGLIRFPYMGCQKLKKVLTCKDFPPDFASKVVLEALFFKTETPYRQWSLAAQDVNTTCCRFVERTYTYRPVKVVEFALPRPRCVVYLDLKKEECVRLFPNARIYSQEFSLGKQGFLLSPRCYEDRQNSSHCFGLFLVMQFKQSVSLHVEYEFFARSKFNLEYLTRCKGNYTFTAGKSVGHRNLFGIPWTEFIADNSHHFINGLLHLKVELTVRQ